MKTYSSRAQSTFQWAPYLFALPTMSLIALFSLAPMLYGVWMSLQKVDVISGTSSFIGITKYIHLFQDSRFGLGVFNTAWYTLTVVPLITAGSIALAEQETMPREGSARASHQRLRSFGTSFLPDCH
jgi:ABC-type sugar transport system permease subunit